MQNFDQPNILLGQFQRRYDTTRHKRQQNILAIIAFFDDYMDVESLKCT